jgi:hypothetical protein
VRRDLHVVEAVFLITVGRCPSDLDTRALRENQQRDDESFGEGQDSERARMMA